MNPVILSTPTSVAELPERYYDVNGSGSASSLDALNVINFLITFEQELIGAELTGAEFELPQILLPIGIGDRTEASRFDRTAVVPSEIDTSDRDSVLKDFGSIQPAVRFAVLPEDLLGGNEATRSEAAIAEWDLALDQLLTELQAQ